ncbi:ankyrin [Neocallimastix sp. 'constans']|jgi:ankyrin repeat protein
MNYEDFEKNLFDNLRNSNENECIDIIENNKNNIENYFSEGDNLNYTKKFSEQLYNVIFQDGNNNNLNNNNLKIIDKILKDDLFKNVLLHLRESDIFIRACINCDENILNWLLTLEINPFIEDKNGMTVLMHAVKNEELLFVVKYLLNQYGDYDNLLNKEDINGETVLFHAIDNLRALKLLVKTKIDINHLNKNHESVLLYCSKNDKRYAIPILLENEDIDTNIIDNEGRTAAFYLIEQGNFRQLSTLRNVNYDYVNKKTNETALSILIKKIDQARNHESPNYIISYIEIIKILVKNKANFNIAIDEEGNTPLMYFVMVKDFCSVYYLIKNYKNELDYNIKNKKGQYFFSLMLDDNDTNRINYILKKQNKLDYHDKYGNNLLIYCILLDNLTIFETLLRRRDDLINEVNDKCENALIIASKLGKRKMVQALLLKNSELNQQDNLGNTALYYAININDDYIVNYLAFLKADLNIKNNKGVSAMDLAKELNNETILKILDHPKSPYNYKPSSSKLKSKKFKSNKNKPEDMIEHITNINKYKSMASFSLEKPDNLYLPFPTDRPIMKKIFDTYDYYQKDEKVYKFTNPGKKELELPEVFFNVFRIVGALTSFIF